MTGDSTPAYAETDCTSANDRHVRGERGRALTPAEVKQLARLGAARQQAMKAYDAAHEALRVYALQHPDVQETEIARVGQVDRMAVRRWRGKKQ